MNDNTIQKQMIKARDEYIDLIKSELMGPGSEFSIPDADHELISSNPLSRYSVGVLFPQGNEVNQDNDETVPIADEEGLSNLEVEEEYESNADSHKEHKNTQSYEFDETANENLDEEIDMASQYLPSSMGVTFLVKGNTEKVRGKVSFATYRSALVSDCVIPYNPENSGNYKIPSELAHKMIYDNNRKIIKLTSKITRKEVRDIFERDNIPENEALILKQISYRFADYCKNGYVRVPHENCSFVVDFTLGDYVESASVNDIDGLYAKISALRTKVEDNIWSLTIMFLNTLEETPAKPHHCFFQSQIVIDSQGNDFTFTESSQNPEVASMDDEECSLELLYRHKKTYGTGLGTSVDWLINDSGEGLLWSEFFPQREVPSMDFSLPSNPTLTEQELSMKYLSDLDDTDKNIKLISMRNLVDLYKAWVESIERKAELLDPKYQTTAARNIAECKRAYTRMYAGVEQLERSDNAYDAFVLANRAMFMQRIHLKMQERTSNIDRYPDDKEISEILLNMDYREEDDSNCKWRPFQIAFLLMDINSIVCDCEPERNVVDLIWFPTGGGKTEAYLGLTAFTIFYRKLTYRKESGGTSVIMRYTLRLLAAQQFTRAATLICACEYIRQDCESRRNVYPKYSLGIEPITIGLWIGGKHIPNTNEEARTHLNKLMSVNKHYYVRNVKERHNKFQVLKCPWCGTKMVRDSKNDKLVGKWGYNMGGKHFYMFCPQEDCNFTKRLPIQIIDDELYINPPTLLFGTVDKFAMMPWDGRIGSFFAIGDNNRSPELIIQDELHLISGSLGTIVGLYEAAIDALCGHKGVYPKIIASTATIRRAKEQCSVLYNREVIQFPAPGLDSEDSFFAREATIDYTKGIFGRRYVGVMPSGKTKAMTEIRIIASLLQKVYTMNLADQIKDKLWTLTIYFNSLKDLGKASTLVDDDVKDFIIRIANRLFTHRRLIIHADELTSRISTTELNETLDKLEKIEFSNDNISNKRYASSVLLATNMISVGIDVARLNTMLIVGQPKLTSEYIQASSRVGRKFPGVVFVQYDATKSRDRSHYEQFRSYHDSFYRFVEPTGATPFSKPARERALHAVLTTLVRQKEALINDKDAIKFDKDSFAQTINDINDFILNRIQEISHRSKDYAAEDINEVKLMIDEFFDYWQSLVSECQEGNTIMSLYFGRRFMVKPPGDEEKRLFKQYHSTSKDSAINTLTSMRNVDTPVYGEIIIWED